MRAFDCSSRITSAMIPAMKAAGVITVCRYLSNNPEKNLSKEEAKLLADNSIYVVLVWESIGDRYSSFTTSQGNIDGLKAIAEALDLGVPVGACIYFAVDTDV